MRRDALREYVRGSLWVLPTAAVVIALAVGAVLSLVRLPPGAPLAFQGTADDARTLLIGIAGTMVTVIALLLGLTVVALQLSSTQFSPRLLRNFLRDRPNQLVLSSFVATFGYAAAGLYTVGVSAGQRTGDYPRLAVTGAIVLLFVSLGLLVYFADHLAHSIQVDSIMRVARIQTLAVIDDAVLGGGQESVRAPQLAEPIAARRSGYLQAVNVVAQALLKLLVDCSAAVGDDPDRSAAIATEARLVVAEADRHVTEPADLAIVYAEAAPLLGAPTDGASRR